MKILITVCRQARMGSYQLPLGPGYISACLKKAGHDVRVLNPNHSTEELDVLLKNEIDGFQPHIVATGGLAFHFMEARYAARMARELLPKATIILGGPLITTQPETIMRAIPEADYGVIGEGEHTIVELVEAIANQADPALVNGIIHRSAEDSTAYRQTPPRAFEKDLDSLPWYDKDGMGLDVFAGLHRPGECAPALVVDEKTRIMPVLTSRGCPYSCTFCCHEAIGRKYRLRSLDNVFGEIEDAMDRFGINGIFFYDDLFCLKRSRLEEFCQRITPLKLRWECSMSAGQIKPEVLEMMRESGCCLVGLGVESMSQKVLTSMQKHATKEEIERALPMIYDARLGIWSNLIFGDPAETLETVTESLEWYATHPRYSFRFARVGYHPGSRIYDEAVGRNLIGDPIKYLSSGNGEINATAMSKQDFSIALVLINRTQFSFGHTGKLVQIKNKDDGSLVAQCVCPHCGSEGTCYTIEGRHLSSGGINCPECNRAYRVPIFVRYQPPEQVKSLEESAKATRSKGGTAEILEAMAMQIVSMDPCNTFAWGLMVECADRSGDRIKAARLLEQQIFFDPCNPSLFESMARRLKEIGHVSASKKYVLKAENLREMGVEGTRFIEVVMSPEELQKTIKNQLELVIQSLPVASFLIGQPQSDPGTP